MLQKELAGLLKDEIENIVSSLDGTASLSSLVREVLSNKRRGLNTEIDRGCLWPLLPLMVSEAICGSGEKSLPAAAGFQFLLAAGDVFDDIQDADSSDSIFAKYGLAMAISVASTLLILGEHSFTRLRSTGANADTIFRTVDTLNSFYTTVCVGQHMDLTEALQQSISEDIYMQIIAMKSAAQIECACLIGALLAGANQNLIDAFASFGRNLGMASQIGNDIQGIVNGKDIVKRKITLPIIYALNLPDKTIHNVLSPIFQKPSIPIRDTEPIKKLLFQSGAVHYATLKMFIYKQKAAEILNNAHTIGINFEKLKMLLT
jgi:geranylgeranyl pyrophosphate synthase